MWRSNPVKSKIGKYPLYYSSDYNEHTGSDILAAKESAKVVIIKLEAIGITAFHLPLLIPSKKIQDQSKLNSQQRKANIYQAFLVRKSEVSIGGVILIDDLVTTGASILEGIRALHEAKITINAVVTACAVGRNSLIR